MGYTGNGLAELGNDIIHDPGLEAFVELRENNPIIPEDVELRAYNFLFPVQCEIKFGKGVIYVWR